MSGEVMPGEHFPGCHPEDAEDPRETPKGYQPADTENCWHCGTPTARGCDCSECYDQANYVPATAVYHCGTCGRWWAWMTGLDITAITFGDQPDDGNGELPVRCVCGPDSTGEAPDERPDCPVHGLDAEWGDTGWEGPGPF